MNRYCTFLSQPCSPAEKNDRQHNLPILQQLASRKGIRLRFVPGGGLDPAGEVFVALPSDR